MFANRWFDLDRQFLHNFNDVVRAFNLAQRAVDPRASRTPEPQETTQLYDAGDHLEFLAEVPGLTQQDITLSLQNDVLTLRYERKVKPPEGFTTHRQERPSAKIAHSFNLPCEVDAEKTSATLKDGLLTVRLTKAPTHQPRQIHIRQD